MSTLDSLELTELSDSYSILQLEPSAFLPADVFTLQQQSFVSITRTENELSLVCPTRLIDQFGLSQRNRSDGWRCMRVELDSEPSETPGIISSIVSPLATAELSVFAIATFDTDHILIDQPERAFTALRHAGHRLNLLNDTASVKNSDARTILTTSYSGDNIPTIETDRLVLRSFLATDFEHVAKFFANSVSALYGGPCDRDTAWRKFATWLGHWTLRGYGPFAIEEKASGTFIGWTGSWNPEGWPEKEITWALLPEFQGKGFATEAAKRALEFSYQNLGWHTAVSVIDNRNSPSIALALRLGAKAEKDVDLFGEPAKLFRHVEPISKT